MKQLLLSLEHYHQRFFPLLRCLFHLTKTLPNAPLGRKVGGRDSYRLGVTPLHLSSLTVHPHSCMSFII